VEFDMKKMLGALLAAATLAISANAAVTVTGTIDATNGGFASSAQTIAGTTLFDFDNSGTLVGTSGNFTFNNNNFNIGTLTVAATGANLITGTNTSSAAPANDATKYLAIYSGGYESITNTLNSFNTLALYWGSPDSFNTIDLLDQSGSSIATVTAADVAGLGALNSGSALVTLTSSQNFYGAKFSSGGNSFELDNIRFSTAAVQAPAGTSSSAVPEPASWAMMIVGFGAVGFASRRRAAGTKAFAI
jgi:hypothetical protein